MYSLSIITLPKYPYLLLLTLPLRLYPLIGLRRKQNLLPHQQNLEPHKGLEILQLVNHGITCYYNTRTIRKLKTVLNY